MSHPKNIADIARRTFVLPRLDVTFSVFPDHGENIHFDAVRKESRAWINQYEVGVCGPKMLAFLENCNFELMNSHTYPYAGPEELRAAMDLANVLFLYDEYTDDVDGASAMIASEVVRRTLRELDFDDGSWICRMMKDFRRQVIDKAGDNVARRLVNNYCIYTDEVAREASLREAHKVLDIPTYIAFRREAGAIRTAFDLVEICLGQNLPQYVHDDPIFTSGYTAAMDLVVWSNDICSYNMEQAKGHEGANLLTVVMKSHGVDLQGAVDIAGDYCTKSTAQLVEARSSLLTRWDPVFSKDAVRTLEAFGDWIRGHNEWLFVTERYFGKENKEVKESRIVTVREPFAETVGLKE